MTLHGSCHCGAHGYELVTAVTVQDIRTRACDCRFCRMHGARTWSDPAGEARVHIGDEGKLQRYRFALRTADYLICRTCGGYLGAMIATGQRARVTLNLALSDVAAPTVAVAYGGENAEDRIARRLRQWTPVRVCGSTVL